MNTYKFSGYVTKDYEIKIEPRNGQYDMENMDYDFLNHIFDEDHNEETEAFTLNHVFIKDGELFANATIKHSFEEGREGADEDEAEDELINWGECTRDINHDHNKKALIEINEIERI